MPKKNKRDTQDRLSTAEEVKAFVAEKDEELRELLHLIDLANTLIRDPEDRIIRWTTGCRVLYGYTAEQALGRVTHELLKTEFPEPLERIRETLRETGRWEGELIHTRADGRKVVAASIWVIHRDSAGNIKAILESSTDISDRIAAQEEQSRLAAIVESSDDAIVSKTVDGTILTWNSGARRLFGYESHEIIGRNIRLLFPPERIYEEEGIRERLTRSERVDHYETVRLTKDGRHIDVSVSISPLIDKQGRVIGASKIARDITSRKQRERYEQEYKVREGLLLRASLEVIAETGVEGLLHRVAEVARELTHARLAFAGHGFGDGSFSTSALSAVTDSGRDRFDRSSLQWSEIYRLLTHGKGPLRLTADALRQTPSALLKDQTVPRGVLAVILIDSHHQTNGMIAIADRQEGEFTFDDEWLLSQLGAVASLALQHIESRYRAEAAQATAEQANKAKDHFLAVLSHELRTPMTPVLAAVFMLQRQHNLPESTHKNLELIRRNVELEARLIDDLLDLTRIERGKVALQKQPLDLGTVIERAVDICRPELDTRGLHFLADLGSEEWIVEGDSARLQQVFWNLLTNAIKFTPSGGCIGIRCRPDGDRVTVEVIDSGQGIEPDDLRRIFNAFEQAQRAQHQGGLGLGLAISKSLVEMHKGTIESMSDGRGTGACFRVQLPLIAIPAHQADRQEQPAREAARPEGLNILLVEDHQDTAEMMKLLLETEGYQVHWASDMSSALNMANVHRFDLLISDLGLPDGSGIDLIRQLRARGLHFPAIAISGYGQDRDIKQSLEAGFAAHMTKPVEVERLFSVLADVAMSRPSA